MSRLALAALALFVFSIPTEDGVAVAGVGSMSRVIGLLAFGTAILSLFDGGRLRVRAPSLFLVIAAAFVLWAGMTFFWSVAPDRTVSRTFQYAQLIVFAWLVHQLARTERDHDSLLQAFVLGCYLMIAVALSAYFLFAREGYRDVVFAANSFAITAGLAIPMAWGLAVRRTFPFLRVLNAAYPLFALAAVVLAASRGGLVTALIGLAIIPLTLTQLGAFRRILLFGAVVVVSWSASTWLPQVVPDLERNLARLEALEEELIGGTMTGRTVIWAAGTEVFATSPLVGVGAGTYARAVEPILGRVRGAHNVFWSVTVTSGLVGVSLLLAMLGVVFMGVVAWPTRRTEYLVLFVALIVAMIPSNAEANKFLWFILALLASARPVTLRVDARVDRQLRGRRILTRS